MPTSLLGTNTLCTWRYVHAELIINYTDFFFKAWTLIILLRRGYQITCWYFMRSFWRISRHALLLMKGKYLTRSVYTYALFWEYSFRYCISAHQLITIHKDTYSSHHYCWVIIMWKHIFYLFLLARHASGRCWLGMTICSCKSIKKYNVPSSPWYRMAPFLSCFLLQASIFLVHILHPFFKSKQRKVSEDLWLYVHT